MSEKNENVIVKYILKNGKEIAVNKIDPLRHLFPLDLVDGERKIRAIQDVQKRAHPNSTPILKIYENGTLSDNL